MDHHFLFLTIDNIRSNGSDWFGFVLTFSSLLPLTSSIVSSPLSLFLTKIILSSPHVLHLLLLIYSFSPLLLNLNLSPLLNLHSSPCLSLLYLHSHLPSLALVAIVVETKPISWLCVSSSFFIVCEEARCFTPLLISFSASLKLFLIVFLCFVYRSEKKQTRRRWWRDGGNALEVVSWRNRHAGSGGVMKETRRRWWWSTEATAVEVLKPTVTFLCTRIDDDVFVCISVYLCILCNIYNNNNLKTKINFIFFLNFF